MESGKQTAQMIKSVKFLKDAKEAIEQVSSVVQQLNAVQEIADNNQRLINVMQNDLQDILNSPYIKPDEVSRVMESFDAIVQQMVSTITTKTKRYRDIISFRKMQDKVNNRETDY